MFQKVAIIGPGLIGGSIGMALRQQDLAETVVGIGRRRKSINAAKKIGAIDEGTLDLEEGLQGSELVLLATPIRAFKPLAAELGETLAPRALLTDVASTKVGVIETISSALRGRPDVAFVPSHPMAGSERSGPEAARPDLFRGAVCIITPLPTTAPASKGLLTDLWGALGARVVSMSPQAHDRLVARISQAPHLAAAAMLHYLDEGEVEFCGGGLRDTTRIAGGDPDLWIDICGENRREICAALRAYIDSLQQLTAHLENGAMGRLREMLQNARNKRENMPGANRGE